jgi:hypothetical protein
MSFSFGRLADCLALRWGAQLADVPCVPCVVAQLAGRAPTCVALFALGRPTCGRALCCVAPILRTALPNLGEAVLKSLPPSQNLFLSILQLVF